MRKQHISAFLESPRMKNARATFTLEHYLRLTDRINDAARYEHERALALRDECLARFGKAPAIPGIRTNEGAKSA